MQWIRGGHRRHEWKKEVRLVKRRIGLTIGCHGTYNGFPFVRQMLSQNLNISTEKVTYHSGCMEPINTNVSVMDARVCSIG